MLKPDHSLDSQTWRRFPDILSRTQWNLKTFKLFWSRIFSSMSESLVSVTGYESSNKTMTQNTTKNSQKMSRNQKFWGLIQIRLNICRRRWNIWRNSLNLKQMEQFVDEEWDKIPEDRCRSVTGLTLEVVQQNIKLRGPFSFIKASFFVVLAKLMN